MFEISLDLPDHLRLEHLLNGPGALGWLWDTEAEAIRVRAARPIEHIQPAMMASLAAWAAWQRERRGRRVLLDPSLQVPYAWDVGLLSALAGRFDGTRKTSWSLPVLRIRTMAEQQTALRRLAEILHRIRDHDAFDAVTYCLSEMVRNVFEHAATSLGAFVSASWFPTPSGSPSQSRTSGREFPRTCAATVCRAPRTRRRSKRPCSSK
jgi:hypothetical protein